MDHLSTEKQELIGQFKAITDSSDDDDTKIIRLLDIHDWNLNNSISSFFDTGFVAESSTEQVIDSAFTSGTDIHQTEVHQSHRPSAINSPYDLSDLIPKLPFAPKISNNWQLEIGLNLSKTDLINKNFNHFTNNSFQFKMVKSLSLVVFLIFFIPNKLVSLLYYLLKMTFKPDTRKNSFPQKFDYQQLLQNEDEPTDEKPESPQEKSDVDFSNSKDIQNLASSYEHLNITTENFNEVHDDCKENRKWFLVLLVNSSKECTEFLNQLFTDETFLKYFSTQNHNQNFNSMIYLNNAEKNPESFEVGETYKVKRLPYIMLINNVTNNPNVMSSMSILYKSNISSSFIVPSHLKSTCHKISQNLGKLINHYQPQVVSVLTDKRELDFSRLLKQKQDDAYKTSLELDKVKKTEKLKQENLAKLSLQKKAFLKHLIDANWFETVNQDQSTRIQIKLPNGERIILKLGDIKLFHLYLYLAAKLDQNDDTEKQEQEEHQEQDFGDITVDNYKSYFSFNFELVQPYPKKTFDQLDDSIQDHVKSGASVLVEYLDESDS